MIPWDLPFKTMYLNSVKPGSEMGNTVSESWNGRKKRDPYHRTPLTEHPPASLVFLNFLRHIQFTPTSGPLYLLSSAIWVHLKHPFFLRKASPTAHILNLPSPSLFTYIILLSFIALLPIWNQLFVIVCFLDSSSEGKCFSFNRSSQRQQRWRIFMSSNGRAG